MLGYFVFIFIAASLSLFSFVTREKGFENLSIKRLVLNTEVIEGEEFKITTIIENNKWLPISFLTIKEKMPIDLGVFADDSYFYESDYMYHMSRYSVSWFERVKRNYTIRGTKRGTYLIRELDITIGDVFGFFSKTVPMTDYVELLIYPKLISVNNLELHTTSFTGDNIIKRWIYKDPLYIKGIREYSVEDRMKDIHWQSSLKMNKLMVKDYDYTSEKEFIIIFNNQCGEPYWGCIDEKAIERGIHLAASLAHKLIEEGVPAGLWTNSQIISYEGESTSEVKPSLNSFKKVMQMCARMDLSPRVKFCEYLNEMTKHLNRNNTYIIITPYLDEESSGILNKLKRAGFLIKIIDVSAKLNLPSIEGIEKVNFIGEGY